jgi:hypothetical protein
MERNRQNILNKAIALLLAMQLFLFGFQAKTRIDQGNSTLETLTWLIQQYIPVLVNVKSLGEKKQRSDSRKPKIKR